MAHGGDILNEDRFDHEHPEVPSGVHPEEEAGREELRTYPWWAGGYLSPIVVVLFTIFWVLAAYWLIGWRVRDWQFGTVPYVPAESVYTTRPFPRGEVPRQVELPTDPQGGRSAER